MVVLIYSKTSLQQTSMQQYLLDNVVYNDAFSIRHFISLFVFVKMTSIQRILYNDDFALTMPFSINKTVISVKTDLRTTLKEQSNDFIEWLLFSKQR